MRYITRGTIRELVIMVAIMILAELFTPRFLVAGPSMQPSFWDDERIIASRIPYLLSEPERGDIVVFSREVPLIKRVIGLPGETIEFRQTELYINNVEIEEPYINEPCLLSSCPDGIWTLSSDEYFVMGDNRNHSNDSRSFGPIHRNKIIGEALIRFWPPQGWGFLKQYRYTP